MTATATSTAASKTTAMRKGRQADSARRRQRVLDTIAKEAAAGEEISVAGIARAAAVDRTFLYRHRDLLEKIHVLEAAPPAACDGAPGPGVTRASLQADLLAAGERAVRLTARIRQLEKRLSEALGEQAWHQTGLGAPPDIDASTRRSPISSRKPPACSSSSPNATRTSPRPAPPAVSSWLASTPAGDTPEGTPDAHHQPGHR
ncbi:MAG: hypothetical protein ACHP9Z_29520 [Streptosporangiales bacterium]